MMHDPAIVNPREPWAVSFGVGAIFAGCLIATVVFMGLTAVMLSMAPEGMVDTTDPANSVPRLTLLIGGVAGIFFLLVGPTVSLALGWLLRRQRSQAVHVLAFTVAGGVVGVLAGIPGGPELALLLGPMVGASAGLSRLVMSRFARV